MQQLVSSVAMRVQFTVLLQLAIAGAARAGTLHNEQYTVLGMREPFRINSDKSDIGFATSIDGDVAFITTLEELLSSWPPAEKLAVVVPGDKYTSELRAKLAGHIAALVLSIDTTNSRPLAESPEEVFPNRAWGVDPQSTAQWNPQGDGSRLQKDTFATLSVAPTEWVTLNQKGRKNVQYPRWAIRVQAFMFATTDSPTCLRRKFCDPIAGLNLLASLRPFNETSQLPIVIAAASVDGDASVRGDAVNARSVVGAIALVGAVDALSRCSEAPAATNLVLALTDADSWGYTGSRALAAALASEEPITPYLLFGGQQEGPVEGTASLLSRATAVIGVGSIGGADLDGSETAGFRGALYSHIHNDESATWHSQLQDWLEAQVGLARATSDGAGLPPSAVHSYLRARKEVPAVVLAEYGGSQFANRFTGSRYDDSSNVDSSAVVRASRQLTRVLSGLLGGTKEVQLPAQVDAASLDRCEQAVNGTLVRGWTQWATGAKEAQLSNGTAECNAVCEEFAAEYGAAASKSYSSVVSGSIRSRLTQSVVDVLYEMNSSMILTQAVSPGLKLTSRRRQWVVTDPTEPMFTESKWKSTSLELFVRDHWYLEWLVLVCGIGLNGLNFYGFRWLMAKWKEIARID